MNINIVGVIMVVIILLSCVPSTMGINYTNKSNNITLNMTSPYPVFASNMMYVSLTGNDSNNGTLQYPKKTIKAAVNTLKDNGTVIIAPGTYNEGNIVVNKSITIRGSTKTEVKVDGTNNGIVFNISGNVKIQNMSIINGKGEKGGAIYNDHNNTLTIVDCIFQDNNAKYGGAIFTYGTCSVNNCEFIRNNAENEGGAINSNFKSNLTVIKSEFNDNNALSAAAIFSGSECKIAESSFNKNIAQQSGGALYNFGKLNITTTSFISNNALFSDGGAIVNKYINNTSPVSIDNCNFNQNHASTSGAINNLGICDVTNSQLTGNMADSYGGSIASAYKLTVKNTTFANNEASKTGGGIANSGTIDLEKNTFTGNIATEGGAITTYGASKINYNKFTNNTAKSNGGAISNNFNGNNTDPSLEINYNEFTNNKATETGGVLFNTGKAILRNNNFTMNTVTTADNGLGGGIINYNGTLYLSEGNQFFHNTIFTGRSTGDPAGGGITNLADGSLFISGPGNIFTDSNIYNEGILNLADCTIEKNTNGEEYLQNKNEKQFIQNNVTIKNSTHTYDLPLNNPEANRATHLDISPDVPVVKQGNSIEFKVEPWIHMNYYIFGYFDLPMEDAAVTFTLYDKNGIYHNGTALSNNDGNAYQTIQTSNLDPGTYWLQIKFNGKTKEYSGYPSVRTIPFTVTPS